MILQALKNFCKNLKYFFVPLGALFLAIAISLTIIVPAMSNAFGDLTGSLRETLESAEISVSEFKSLFTAEFNKLPGNLIDAVEYVLTTSWLKDTLTALLASVGESAGEHAGAIASASSVFLGKTTDCISVFFWFCVLGLVVGYWLTKSLVRREIARRTFRQFLFSWVIDTALVVLVAFLSARLYVLWRPGGIIAAALSILLFGFVSLLEAYLLYAHGRLPFRKIINIKNIFSLFAGNFLVMLTAALLVSLVAFLLGSGIAVIVAFPLIEIAVIVNGMNADSYVIGQIGPCIAK